MIEEIRRWFRPKKYRYGVFKPTSGGQVIFNERFEDWLTDKGIDGWEYVGHGPNHNTFVFRKEMYSK